jgi:hypothetical protein
MSVTMRTRQRSPLTYANVVSTLAVFLALGGGAWAASGSLVSSSGEVRGCVPARGGVLRVVRPHTRCKNGEEVLDLTRAPVTGPVGPQGPAGLQGPVGPAGPQGPADSTDSYSFSLGPFDGGSATASFGTNQVRLFCAEGTCSAQVEASDEGAILGTDESGEFNEPPTTTKMIFGETPGIVTVATISSSAKPGEKLEGEGHVTLWLRNGSGWQIDLHILTEPDGGGNIRLLGTATPTTIDDCAGFMGGTICPPLDFA